MTVLRKLVGQTAVYGISSIVGRLLNFLLVPLYTTIFVPGEFGVLSVLMSWVAFAMVVLSYGLETSFFHFAAKEKNHVKVFSTGLLSLALSTSFFLVLTIPNSISIARLLKVPENPLFISLLALTIALDTLTTLPFAKLRLDNRPWRFASIRLVNISVNIGLNLFFFLLCPELLKQGYTAAFFTTIYDPTFGIGYIFISYVVSSFITCMLLLPQFFMARPIFDFVLWKRMISYGLPLLIGGLAYVVNEMIDKILLVYLLPTNIASTQVGIYSACYKISIFMTLFIQAYRYGVEPFFFTQSQKADAKKQFAKLMHYFVAFTSFIFLGVNVFIDFLKAFIRDDSYHVGLKVVPILLLANLFAGVYYNLSVWYKVTGKTRYGAYFSVFGALITITLNIILIPSMSYLGSAYATLFCYFSMCVASYYVSRNHYPIPYNLKFIALYLFSAIGLYYIWGYLCFENNLANSISSFSICFVYILIVLAVEKKKRTTFIS